MHYTKKRTVDSWIFLMLIFSLLLLLPACSDSDDTSADGDSPDGDISDGDTPDGDTSDSDASDGDAPDGDTPDGDVLDGDAPDGDTPDGDVELLPDTSKPEIIGCSINRSCIGCDEVSICNRPPLSDTIAMDFAVFPNKQTGLMFAAERWEAWGRSLDLESCHLFEGDALDPIIIPPSGIDCLNAGDISLSSEMGILDSPLVLGYAEVTHNYPATARRVNDTDNKYEAGQTITLEGSGGPDVAAFSQQAQSVDTIKIEEPSTDEAGKVANIEKDKALTVKWSGGEGFEEIVIMMDSRYCTEKVTAFLACRVTNDGEFVIGEEYISKIKWANYSYLMLSMSDKVALDLPEFDETPYWSLRSSVFLPVYYDPDANELDGFECDSDSMSEGFAGLACQSSEDCGGGCCIPEIADTYFKDGYCSLIDCSSDADCPADALCREHGNPNFPFESYCAKICESDDECRPPFIACMAAGTGGRKACVNGMF